MDQKPFINFEEIIFCNNLFSTLLIEIYINYVYRAIISDCGFNGCEKIELL